MAWDGYIGWGGMGLGWGWDIMGWDAMEFQIDLRMVLRSSDFLSP